MLVAQSRNSSRRELDYKDVLRALAEKGISIRVASPKLVMEEVRLRRPFCIGCVGEADAVCCWGHVSVCRVLGAGVVQGCDTRGGHVSRCRHLAQVCQAAADRCHQGLNPSAVVVEGQ